MAVQAAMDTGHVDLAAMAEELGTSEEDIRYRARLATLLRIKRQERVPLRPGNGIVDYDKIKERRFPVGRGLAKLTPERPPTYPYLCKPRCEVCFEQFFLARLQVSDSEADSAISLLSKSIFDDLAYLREALGQYADSILTRWRKKSVAKRTEFLMSLSPKTTPSVTQETTTSSTRDGLNECVRLCDQKWAAVHLIKDHSQSLLEDQRAQERFLRENGIAKGTRAQVMMPLIVDMLEKACLEDQAIQYRTTWLLPYLDIQSLAEEPLLLLSLLHYRTAHQPEEWMMFDNEQLKLAEHWETLIPEFNRHCVVMHGSEYGRELVPWDKDRCHRWEIVGYQKAQHILTAQQQMLRFLRLAVDGLLKGATGTDGPSTVLNACYNEDQSELPDRSVSEPKQDRPSPKWDQLVKNGFFSFGNSSAQSIRASANQPFSAPPSFDPIKTAELVEAMFRESTDELELAQTDPAFVQYGVRALMNTMFSDRIDDDTRWDWFMDEVLSNYHRRFYWWRQMAKECHLMLAAYKEYQDVPSTEHRQAYEVALFMIHDVSVEHEVQQMALVNYSLGFQRGFEHNYKWSQTTDAHGKKEPIATSNDYFATDKLFWSLKGLGFDEHRKFTMEPGFHFRVLDDYLSRASFQERSRISESLLRHVSETAVVDEVRTTLECSRLYDRQPDIEAPRDLSLRKDFSKFYQQELSIPDVIRRSGAGKHLRALCENHAWPKGPVDALWLDKAEAARGQLNELGQAYRLALKSQQIRNGWPKYLIDEDWDALSASTRPENIAAVEAETQRIKEKLMKPKRALTATNQSKSENVRPQYPTDDKPTRFVPATPREKLKTRNTEAQLVLTPEEVTGAPAAEHSVNTTQVIVKAENFRLFTAMFPSDKRQTKAFSWQHFLSAMVDAGFMVTQGSGSAVTFKNDVGTISFHRPHPDPTIDPVMLMLMGKRMRKWFGWCSETFAMSE